MFVNSSGTSQYFFAVLLLVLKYIFAFRPFSLCWPTRCAYFNWSCIFWSLHMRWPDNTKRFCTSEPCYSVDTILRQRRRPCMSTSFLIILAKYSCSTNRKPKRIEAQDSISKKTGILRIQKITLRVVGNVISSLQISIWFNTPG